MRGSFLATLIFLGAVGTLGIPGKFPLPVALLYFCASVVTFAVYALDKSAARNGRWRTRESTLHLLAVIGGWPGALLAQQLLRHKSYKQPFRTLFLGTVCINCVLLLFLLAQ